MGSDLGVVMGVVVGMVVGVVVAVAVAVAVTSGVRMRNSVHVMSIPAAKRNNEAQTN